MSEGAIRKEKKDLFLIQYYHLTDFLLIKL